MNLHAHSCIALLRIAYGQYVSAATHSHLILAQAGSLLKPESRNVTVRNLTKNHIANTEMHTFISCHCQVCPFHYSKPKFDISPFTV